MTPGSFLSRSLIALSLTVVPSLARAQLACPGGQAVSADTAGHCCWPAQAWSSSRGACVGAPQCPAGMVAQGEVCAPMVVAREAPAAAAGQPVAPWGAVAPPAPLPAAAPTYAPQPLYPTPAYAPGLPVRFVPNSMGDRLTVSVTTPAGPQQCEAPCVMSLLPGEHTVTISGDVEYTDTITVVGNPLHVRIRRYRSERMIWGVAGTGVGAALFVAGLAMSGDCTTLSFSTVCERSSAANGLMIVGSTLAIVAATTGFTTMGSNSLAVTTDYNLYVRARGPRFAGVGASPMAGGGLIGATLQF
jgi:hypothetical protein